MPVVAAVERGRQLSRRSHIRFAVQRVTDLVGIFFVGACERKLGEPFSSVDVKHGWGRGALCPHFANGEEQEHSADNVFHYGYFRRISPNATNAPVNTLEHLLLARFRLTDFNRWKFSRFAGNARPNAEAPLLRPLAPTKLDQAPYNLVDENGSSLETILCTLAVSRGMKFG